MISRCIRRSVGNVLHHHYAHQNQGPARRRYRAGTASTTTSTMPSPTRCGRDFCFEWMRDEAGLASAANPVRQPEPRTVRRPLLLVSVGLNHRPHPNVLIRPGPVPTGSDGQRQPFNDGLNKNPGVGGDQRECQFLTGCGKRPPAACLQRHFRGLTVPRESLTRLFALCGLIGLPFAHPALCADVNRHLEHWHKP